MKFDTPTENGYYWAKLVGSTFTPDGEDWDSLDWEPVEVYINNLDSQDPDHLRVAVCGIGPSLPVGDFIWGPKISRLDFMQPELVDWITTCFGPNNKVNPKERAHRFMEEALESYQTEASLEDALDLVNHVFKRKAGKTKQEVGGVAITLAMFCTSKNINFPQAALDGVKDAWSKVDKVKAKEAARKDPNSPIPGIID